MLVSDPALMRALTRRGLLGSAALVGAAVLLAACDDSSSRKAEAPGSNAGNASAESPAASSPAPAPAAPRAAVPSAQGDVDMAKALQPGSLPDIALGEENAPVTIIEYMSLTCTHCANFHNRTFDTIKANYVDTGKARFILREFPLDPVSTAAFMLARCNPQNPAELSSAAQYVPLVSMLFKQQRAWAAPADNDVRSALLQTVKLAGYSQQSFEACLTNQQLLDQVNGVVKRAADEFGVNSTPTFLINGKKYPGDMPVETMSALIDSLL